MTKAYLFGFISRINGMAKDSHGFGEFTLAAQHFRQGWQDADECKEDSAFAALEKI